MSIARHHAEWLSLLDISGPFLSLPVLLKIFPQGLVAHDPEHVRLLRLAYHEWADNQSGLRPDPAIHWQWLRFVLRETLSFPDEVIAEGQAIPQTLHADVAEQGERLRPDLVITTPEGHLDAGKPRLLVHLYPHGQHLEKPLPDRRWKASPATRMMELLHGTNCRLGLVTNGEQWMLVDAPRGETTGFISWYAPIWFEEHITLRAFRSLLSVQRFFSVPANETIEAMRAESASNQHEVIDQLGYQVRKAVEVLIRSLDQADQTYRRQLLAGVSETELYEAALTVMMRLVFLFSAEERGLLLLGDPLYDEHYAVSTLRDQLQETADQHGQLVLARRHDAWCRLLATFRAVYGGVEHDRLTLPAYGGHLFNPDRYPFLEGRQPGTSWNNTPANPLPVDNRTVLHLLEALQMLQVKIPGGGPAEARRLSFRAFDIEQIGHVYEGMLDHTAKRATEPMLGLLGTQNKEPEVGLSELERLQHQGEKSLVQFLSKETGRSASAIKRSLGTTLDRNASNRFLVACGNDMALWNRIQPFAALVRNNTFDYPEIVLPGSVYVTAGTDRRSTGTHYTPRSLTEPIVQYTLEPLVYHGPAEGKPRDEWQLRSAPELLALKICDIAVGSGAFLVQACRYLSERVSEAWEQAEAEYPNTTGITITGQVSTGAPDEVLIPQDPDERLTYARRLIAQKCLYGVDRNPLAVEMAKLSLWLLTLARGKPFTFLDHAIKHGDSLVGIHDLEQLRVFSLAGKNEEKPLFLHFSPNRIEQVETLRKRIAEMPVATIQDTETQEELLQQAEEQIQRLKYAADLLVAPEFQLVSSREKASLRAEYASKVNLYLQSDDMDQFDRETKTALGGRVTLHWPLEFPEIFNERNGFDAIIGNPPFMGGQMITGASGTAYRNYLVEQLANGRRGSADLCAYFFLRAQHLIRSQGGFSMLATNTIAQGDTREVGLDQLTQADCVVSRAVSSQKWPGSASLEVSVVCLRRGSWNGAYVLDDNPVSGITPYLTKPGEVAGNPYRLAANAGKSFQGSIILGLGFVLTPEEAEHLRSKDARNRDVIFPYLNAQDLNTRPDQSPSRWVINFFDWPLQRGAKGRWENADQRQRKAWLKDGMVPDDYPDPVAADYPDCLAIVEEKVKPEREHLKNNAVGQRRKSLWWRYGSHAPTLYAAIKGMKRILIIPIHSKFLNASFSPNNLISSHANVVVATESFTVFGIIQSSVHTSWTMTYQSSLGTGSRYTPSDCFETFPFPNSSALDLFLETIGETYHQYRQQLMLTRQEGLTDTYNRFHSPDEISDDMKKFRELHIEMDHAVVAAYGWTDVALSHGFHETKWGLRFTFSEFARREILLRLLQLNHERYAEEKMPKASMTSKISK